MSELESNKGSFTAEQLVELLEIFNTPLSVLTGKSNTSHELQNTLAYFGASHLREAEGVVPRDGASAEDLVRDVLLAPQPSARFITALAPVVVEHIDTIVLPRLYDRFLAEGRERRLAWLVRNVRAALEEELSRSLDRERRLHYARAKALLETLKEREPYTAMLDVLDPHVRSAQTIRVLVKQSSPLSQTYGIATRIQVDDFRAALKASREAHR